MQNDIVPDRHLASYDEGKSIGNYVKGRIVLNVRSVPDDDGVHVAPNDGSEPYACIIADSDISNDHGCWSYVYIFANNRGFAPEMNYHAAFLAGFYLLIKMLTDCPSGKEENFSASVC